MFFHLIILNIFLFFFIATWIAVCDCKQLSREALATWIAVCDCKQLSREALATWIAVGDCH